MVIFHCYVSLPEGNRCHRFTSDLSTKIYYSPRKKGQIRNVNMSLVIYKPPVINYFAGFFCRPWTKIQKKQTPIKTEVIMGHKWVNIWVPGICWELFQGKYPTSSKRGTRWTVDIEKTCLEVGPGVQNYFTPLDRYKVMLYKKDTYIYIIHNMHNLLHMLHIICIIYSSSWLLHSEIWKIFLSSNMQVPYGSTCVFLLDEKINLRLHCADGS